jgi:hypothetical protein
MASLPKQHMPFEEYLEIERRAEEKSEYFDGEMFLISGGTAAHSLTSSNVIRTLSNQLFEQGCLLISQTPHRIEPFIRRDDRTWTDKEFHSAEEIVQLESVACTLLLADVYLKIS